MEWTPSQVPLLWTDIVVTVEPGVYLPGKFGVRIEDMILVKNDGIEDLTTSTHQLMTVIN